MVATMRTPRSRRTGMEYSRKTWLFSDSFNKREGETYKLGVNRFADLTNEEFIARNGYRPGGQRSHSKTPFRYANVDSVPRTRDWRKEGAVTHVKDQGYCGKLNVLNYKTISL